MSALYVLAIVIIFDASKFAHMACLYPNEYAAAGLSSVEIVIRDIVAIVLVIVANYIKVSLDKSVEEKIKENQKDQQTKKWKKFLNG